MFQYTFDFFFNENDLKKREDAALKNVHFYVPNDISILHPEF